MSSIQLNGDQVAWICDALRRYGNICATPVPPISRSRQVAETAFVLELAEILGAKLNTDAIYNATPYELRTPQAANLASITQAFDEGVPF